MNPDSLFTFVNKELIAEPVEPEVDAQRLVYREAYAELFAPLLRQGVADGSFSSR